MIKVHEEIELDLVVPQLLSYRPLFPPGPPQMRVNFVSK